MANVTRTYRQLHEFLTASRARLATTKTSKVQDTKFVYALRKVVKKLTPLWEKHLEQREDIDMELAAVDTEGVLLRDANGQLRFTREDLKKRAQRVRALYQTTFAVQPYSVEFPDDVTAEERDAYSGFLRDPADLEAVEPEGWDPHEPDEA